VDGSVGIPPGVPDIAFAEDTSVVTRFAPVLNGVVSEASLEQASIREPARIVTGPEVEGVKFMYLDLSAKSVTGTFKDWVACVTAAYCVERGIPAFVSQSSGNTANALARYASHSGVRAVILYPRISRYKIHAQTAKAPGITTIEVDRPEPQLKIWADEAASRHDLPWLPRLDLQRAGNRLRAHFISSWLAATGARCDWHAQALSSAFGPIGTYEGFRQISEAGVASRWPRFFGVQQEAVHPFATDITGYGAPDPECELLEETLFRTEPTVDLLDAVREICHQPGGTVAVIPNERVREREPEALALLQAAGFTLSVVAGPDGTRPRELSSVICLAGVLDAIGSGTIRSGESVLVALTGGLSNRDFGRFEPSLRVERDDPDQTFWDLLDEAVATL
jgi:hypothetical protein